MRRSLDNALELLNSATEIIGENSILHAGIGICLFQYVNMGIKQEEYIEKFKNYCRKIFELDPEFAQGHLLTGMVFTEFKGNKNKAMKHLHEPLKKDRNDPETICLVGI